MHHLHQERRASLQGRVTRAGVPVKSTLVQTSRGYPIISTRSANWAQYGVLYGANQGANEVQTSVKVGNRSTPAARIDPGRGSTSGDGTSAEQEERSTPTPEHPHNHRHHPAGPRALTVRTRFSRNPPGFSNSGLPSVAPAVLLLHSHLTVLELQPPGLSHSVGTSHSAPSPHASLPALGRGILG